MPFLDTDGYSAALRAASVRLDSRELLVAQLRGSDQEVDGTDPLNCQGMGRVHHFRLQTPDPWPANPLPILPAARRLGIPVPEVMQTQVFQLASCNWRCWYCFVPYRLLRANPQNARWMRHLQDSRRDAERRSDQADRRRSTRVRAPPGTSTWPPAAERDVGAERNAGGRRVGRGGPGPGGVVMAGQPRQLPPQLQAWVDARRRYRLSHAQVSMARELGLNPRKFGGLANHRQEPWKAPLPEFIEDLYRKRFGRERPEVVVPIEELHRQRQQTQTARRAVKARGQQQSEAPNRDGDAPHT